MSGSLNEKGPWQTLVEDELADTRHKPAALLNFTFENPVEIKFLKFELVSFWGTGAEAGGGLQYFAAIPATGMSVSVRILNSNLYFFIKECSSLGLNGLAAVMGKGGRLEPGTQIKVKLRLKLRLRNAPKLNAQVNLCKNK